VPFPEASDGLAIIGFDEERGIFLQHAFDACGIARLSAMRLDGRVWKLWRDTADISPRDVAQRLAGTFREGVQTIVGGWEIARDGSTREPGGDLSCVRVR
jgi:hypothetical protein